jgi:two-component system response regulator NreC
MVAIQTVIVATNDLVRGGIQKIVEAAKHNFQVVGSFASITEVEQFLSQSQQRVILLLDDSGSQFKPIPTVKNLVNRYPQVKIVVISDLLQESYIQQLLNNGARGFLYREDHLEENLIGCILAVLDNTVSLSPKASGLPYSRSPSSDLNGNDRSVLKLMAQGYTTQEIAIRLNITMRTIYRIRTKIRHYLNVRTNEKIIEAARKKGLLDVEGDCS